MKHEKLIFILFLISSNFLFSQSLEIFFEDGGVYEMSKYTHPDYKNKVNDQMEWAKEQCLSHLNREFSK